MAQHYHTIWIAEAHVNNTMGSERYLGDLLNQPCSHQVYLMVNHLADGIVNIGLTYPTHDEQRQSPVSSNTHISPYSEENEDWLFFGRQ